MLLVLYYQRHYTVGEDKLIFQQACVFSEFNRE